MSNIHDQDGPPRRAGRPKGTRGSALLRAALREHLPDRGTPAQSPAGYRQTNVAKANEGRRQAATTRLSVVSLPFRTLQTIGEWGDMYHRGIQSTKKPTIFLAKTVARLAEACQHQFARTAAAMVTSDRCMAVVLKCLDQQTGKDASLLGALAWQASRQLWHSFLSWIGTQIDTGNLKGHVLAVFWTGDETQTKLSLDDWREEVGLSKLPPPKHPDGSTRTEFKRTTKVLQQQCWIAVLVQGRATKNELVMLSGELLCPLYALQDTSAECFAEGFRRATSLPIMQELVGKFTFFLRGSTLDKAGGCQRFIRNHCCVFPIATPMPSCCFIHTSHTAARAASSLQDTDISGMFSWHDHLMDGAACSLVQKALEVAMTKQVQVHALAPRPTDLPELAWKDRLLDLLLPDTCLANMKRKHILGTKLNGMVGEEGLSHYGELEIDAIKKVSRALITRAQSYVQRARWLKDVQTIAGVALIFTYAPHAMIDAIWTIVHPKAQRAPGSRLDVLTGFDDTHASVVPHAEVDIKQQNKQQKINLLQWAQTMPGPRLVRLVLCMQPPARYMQVQLRYASDRHQQETWKAATDTTDESHQRADNPIARLPAVAAACGAYTAKFWEHSEVAWHDPQVWSTIPTKTREELSRAFATLARNGGGVFFLTEAVFQQHHFRLLRLLHPDTPDELVDEILADPLCMRDLFAKAFLRVFHSPQLLRSELAKAVLVLVAVLARIDTLPLECRFAWLRRIALMKSIQTHCLSFIRASSRFVMARTRVLANAIGSTQTHPAFSGCSGDAATDKVAGEPSTSASDNTVVGGGPWRSWVSKNLREAECDLDSDWWTKLGKDYRTMKIAGGEEWDRLVEQGRWAKEAKQAGGVAFPPKLACPQYATRTSASTPGSGSQSSSQAIAEIPADNALQTAVWMAQRKEADHSDRVHTWYKDARRTAAEDRKAVEESNDKICAWSLQRKGAGWYSAFPEGPGIPTPSVSASVNFVRLVMPVTSMIDTILKLPHGKLLSCTRQLWEKELALITPASCPHYIPRAQKLHSNCFHYGICVCSSRQGVAAANCYRQWQTVMGKALAPHGPLRRFYDEGVLVLHFTGSNGGSVYACPAWLNLTSKLGCFLHLVPDTDPVRTKMAEAHGHTSLVKSTGGHHGFKLIVPTFFSMNMAEAWSIKALSLVLSPHKIKDPRFFVPEIALCRPLDWAELMFGGLNPPAARPNLLRVQRPLKRKLLNAGDDEEEQEDRKRHRQLVPLAGQTRKSRGRRQVASSRCRGPSGHTGDDPPIEDAGSESSDDGDAGSDHGSNASGNKGSGSDCGGHGDDGGAIEDVHPPSHDPPDVPSPPDTPRTSASIDGHPIGEEEDIVDKVIDEIVCPGVQTEDKPDVDDEDEFGPRITHEELAGILQMPVEDLLRPAPFEEQESGDSEVEEGDESESQPEAEEPTLKIKQREGWTYTPWGNKGWLVHPERHPHDHLNAHCGNPDHGKRCHFDRTITSKRRNPEPGRGRSAALSVAWLECAFDDACATRKAHQKFKKIVASREGHELRLDMRARMEASDRPGIQYVLQHVERPLFDDEPAEVVKHSY